MHEIQAKQQQLARKTRVGGKEQGEKGLSDKQVTRAGTRSADWSARNVRWQAGTSVMRRILELVCYPFLPGAAFDASLARMLYNMFQDETNDATNEMRLRAAETVVFWLTSRLARFTVAKQAHTQYSSM